jgi:hypothetical protein
MLPVVWYHQHCRFQNYPEADPATQIYADPDPQPSGTGFPTGLGSLPYRFFPGLALKNPPKKTHPKKPKKTHLKKPNKNGFFWVFLNFLFFMKIIQTFLFQTDFL